MAKGVYKIERYRAELIDGEWVKVELVDTIDNIENRMTADYAYALWANDLWSADDNAIIGVSEAIYVGAHTAASNTIPWTLGAILGGSPAAYFPAAGMDDAYYEMVTIVQPPPTGPDRQIRSLCLSSNQASNRVSSIVALSTPCPQADNEILQITYRVTGDITTLQANSQTSAVIANDLFRTGMYALDTIDGTSIYHTGTTQDYYILNFGADRWGDGICERVANLVTDDNEIQYTDTTSVLSDWPQGMTRRANFFARFGVNNSSGTPGRHCGFPIKGCGTGNASGEGIRHISSVQKGTTSSVQNTFGRIADDAASRRPYLDTPFIATSAATVNLVDSGGEWVNYLEDSYNMPYLYRITMETGGIVGTATYKLRRRKLVHWYANSSTWEPSGLPIPTINWIGDGGIGPMSDDGSTNRHGQINWNGLVANTANLRYVDVNAAISEAGFIQQRYMYPDALFYDYTGITIHNVDGQYTNLDTNSTPALSVTGLLQVASDGSTIYAADENTGLYRIERDIADYTTSNYTITTPAPPGITDTTSCRGVTTGYAWQEGSISKIRVVFGGANYAVADIVSIVGANGTSATAVVSAVDADGVITSVTVTNTGSGYIQDNIQAYVSSGSGIGAALKAEVGTNGELWALFDDTTDGFLYLAHATNVGSNDWTSGLTFATAGDTITRTDGTSFITDGFLVGQELFITGAEDAGNNGLFTITVVTATVITVSENLTNSTGADTTAQLRGVAWEIMTETITTTETLTYADNGASADTITGTGTSFITQGFREGMKIVISASTSNDGIYTIDGITATVITLVPTDALVTEGPNSDTMATLTDFTLTAYTSGSPGRTGIIGLLWDREHADDRFAMLTPATKNNNDGIGATTAATFSWWSFANSTGTTAAGTTDFILTASHNGAAALGVEQLATQCIAPMNNDNLWVTNGDTGLEGGSWTFGTAGNTEWDSSSNGYICSGRVANLGMKDKTMDTVVPGKSTGTGTNAFVYRKNTAQFNSATTFEGVLANTMVDRVTTWSPNYHINGAAFSSWGEGMMTCSLNSGGASGNAYCVWGFNGDGTLAGATAGEEQLPYGTWDEFGWDGTRWVLGNASAKTTHAQSSFSGNTVNINFTNGTMVGGGFASTDWAGDGFSAGDLITVTTAEDDGNNGGYVIESLSGTTLTITPYSNSLTVTNVADTTATIVGDEPLLDGLGFSFDDTGGTNPLVIGEYYDAQVLDGILNDNATTAAWDTLWYEGGNESGTTISDADHIGVTGSIVTTAPSADIGFVTAEPFGCNNTTTWWSNFSVIWWSEPGMVAQQEAGTGDLITGEQNLGTGDFALRFKQVGSHNITQVAVGLVPWASVVGGVLNSASLDDNLRFDHDLGANPTLDIYNIEVYATGTGGVQFTENADRIVTIAAQDETDFDGAASNGTFIGGDGGGGTAHVVSDILTMDDGSTITVDAIDGNDDVTQFTVTTSSTTTRGRTEVSVGSNDYTNLDLNSGTNDITRSDGTAFDTDGWKVGMKLVIYSATESANNGIYTITAVSATILTLAESITTTNATDATVQINSAIVQVSSDGVGTDFALILGTNNEASAAIGGDEYTIARVGAASGNIRYSLNGVEFYRTAGAVNTDFGIGIDAVDINDGFTVYDIEMDYTIARRLRSIGNGTTTGAHNPNFMCHPYYTAGTDFTVQIDGVDATINNDGSTSPSLGSVTLLPRTGRIWFNSGDDGKAITTTWRTTHIINLI